MTKYNLKASQKSFEAIDPPSKYYVELDDLLNGKYLNNVEGFLVVKNVFSHDLYLKLQIHPFNYSNLLFYLLY